MQRVLIVVCAFTTLILACLIIFRKTTKEKSPGDQQSQHLQDVATQIADSFAKVKTRPLNLDDFKQALHDRAGTNLIILSAIERQKLFACIGRFYACYSSGDFDGFKNFRLHPPFTVSEGLVAAAKKFAAEQGLKLKTDEDVVHISWDHFNSTNKIGQVCADSIRLSAVKRHDMGAVLRQPSVSKWPELQTAMCWEGAVTYAPPPAQLLKKDGTLLFFTLELFVRFNHLAEGPATPLVLLAYWDPTREDWMPYALCTMLHVGNYETIF